MLEAGLLFVLLKILWPSLVVFVSLIGGLVVGGFILGYLERLSNSLVLRSFGMAGIYVTAWLGTPIHELSHAAMCVVFRHRITGVKLLQAAGPDGTIGYVTHAYNPDSLYQRIGNLFIGLAPLVGGSLGIFLFSRILEESTFKQMVQGMADNNQIFLFTDPNSWVGLLHTTLTICSGLFAAGNTSSASFWFFLILAVCTASHMSLSREDIRGAASGAGAMLLLIAVANTLSALLDQALYGQMLMAIGRVDFFLLILLSLAIFFSAIKCLISGIVYGFVYVVNNRRKSL